jgi:hypothetical protein
MSTGSFGESGYKSDSPVALADGTPLNALTSSVVSWRRALAKLRLVSATRAGHQHSCAPKRCSRSLLVIDRQLGEERPVKVAGA